MMLTRCPHCATAFRVTPEQLRIRGGQVRCGHCQGVFNALDYLEEEGPMPTRPVMPRTGAPLPPAFQPPAPPLEPFVLQPTRPAAAEASVEPEPAALPQETPAPFEDEAAHLAHALQAGGEGRIEPRLAFDEPAVEVAVPTPMPAPEPQLVIPEATPVAEAEPEPALAPVVSPLGDDFLETPEQNRIPEDLPLPEKPVADIPDKSDNPPRGVGQRGQLPAGLNALGDEEGLSSLIGTTGAPGWLYGVALGLLSLLLMGQALYHYRTPLASNSVLMAALYKVVDIQVPLPRITELVSIEASDLQADASRGQLVLGATVKNRANFAQDWPALELTLTDARDGVLSRRVLFPADYLPADAPPVLAMRGELAIKLWLSVGKLNAAGYRLYVFYP